jgi:hypothetical protein
LVRCHSSQAYNVVSLPDCSASIGVAYSTKNGREQVEAGSRRNSGGHYFPASRKTREYIAPNLVCRPRGSRLLLLSDKYFIALHVCRKGRRSERQELLHSRRFLVDRGCRVLLKSDIQIPAAWALLIPPEPCLWQVWVWIRSFHNSQETVVLLKLFFSCHTFDMFYDITVSRPWGTSVRLTVIP